MAVGSGGCRAALLLWLLCDKCNSLFKISCSSPGTSDVHTQRFAFRAPQEDDESVKISNLTCGRSSAPLPVLPASRPWVERPPKRQFLFNTNEPLSRSRNFATLTKQSTSFFLFSTNERSPIATHGQFQSPKTSFCSGSHRSTFSLSIYSLVGDHEVSEQNPAGRNDTTQRKPLICHGFEIFR